MKVSSCSFLVGFRVARYLAKKKKKYKKGSMRDFSAECSGADLSGRINPGGVSTKMKDLLYSNKEKVLRSPRPCPNLINRWNPAKRSGWCETRQAQGRDLVDRAEPEMGDGLPSRSLVVQSGSTGPGVAAGESHSESPRQGGPVDEDIVSAVRLRGRVLELSSTVQKRPVKMLIDSGATGNFVSDAMVTALKLQVQQDEDDDEVTLADGTVVSTAGYVQFVMKCGDFKGKIVARVFPNLHKECILGIPWLEYENPIIDWTRRHVTIQRPGCILTLPVVRRRQQKPSIETVNLCSAKQVARWFRRRKVDQAYLAFIRPVHDEEEIVPVVPEKTETGCDVEKAYHKDMPEEIKAVLQDYKDIFPTDLPSGLPPVRMGHEFKIELEDETPPIHRPIYKLSPLELEEAKKQIQYMLEHGYIDRRYPPMEHRCCLHRRRMAAFDFVSITAGSTKRRSRTGTHFLSLRSCLIVWGAPRFTAASIFDPGIGRYR